jgi:hypothetical protein
VNDVVAGGLIGVGGVVVGSVISFLGERAATRRAEALEVGAMLAETYDMLWGETEHRTLQVQLMKINVRLGLLGVPPWDLHEYESAAIECWRSGKQSYDLFLDVGEESVRGIDSASLRRFETAIVKINRELRPGLFSRMIRRLVDLRATARRRD